MAPHESCDVVVIGCGGAGSAAAWHLAERGQRVIGLDRFDHGHIRGSSHGTERILRVAYVDAVHARLAATALDGWARLERDAGVQLRTPTDGYDTGDPDELEVIAQQCEAVGVAVDRLTAHEATERFPGVRFLDPAIRHATATVHADRALVAMRSVAEGHGADFRTEVRVERLEPLAGDGGVRVHHAGGAIDADRCVVTTGAWAADGLLAAVEGRTGGPVLPPLTVTREQVGFFRTVDGAPGADAWPTLVARRLPNVYALPTPDGLVKVGEHHTGVVIDPDAPTGVLDPFSWARLLGWVAEHAPGLDPEPVRSATCLYASLPGDTFLIDAVGPVVIGVGLSGHGFKFLPEIGRSLADLAEGVAWAGNPFSVERPPIDVGTSGTR